MCHTFVILPNLTWYFRLRCAYAKARCLECLPKRACQSCMQERAKALSRFATNTGGGRTSPSPTHQSTITVTSVNTRLRRSGSWSCGPKQASPKQRRKTVKKQLQHHRSSFTERIPTGKQQNNVHTSETSRCMTLRQDSLTCTCLCTRPCSNARYTS